MIFTYISVLIAALFCGSNCAVVPDKYKSFQLYVFGGRENFTLSSVSHYNTTSAHWDLTTRMSQRRDSFCAVAVDTKIYLFGGYDVMSREVSDNAEVYDCETGTYSQYRALPYPLGNCDATVLGDYIYIAGGVKSDDDYQSTGLADVFRYNIKTTRLDFVKPMIHPRYGHQLVALGGMLYAIGGYQNGHTMERYDPAINEWTDTQTNMTYEHNAFSAIAHKGKIYVLDSTGFEAYTPEADRWEMLTPPESYYAGQLMIVEGRLWSVGGDNYADQGTRTVLTYDEEIKSWIRLNNMNVPRKAHQAFAVNH